MLFWLLNDIEPSSRLINLSFIFLRFLKNSPITQMMRKKSQAGFQYFINAKLSPTSLRTRKVLRRPQVLALLFTTSIYFYGSYLVNNARLRTFANDDKMFLSWKWKGFWGQEMEREFKKRGKEERGWRIRQKTGSSKLMTKKRDFFFYILANVPNSLTQNLLLSWLFENKWNFSKLLPSLFECPDNGKAMIVCK